MAYYRTCPLCGSNNDPGEACDCRETKKRSPRCIGNDLGQMLTHCQFINRFALSQGRRRCDRG